MNYDTLQELFWSVTYFLMILVGIKYRDEHYPAIPFLAGILNFGWEIVALVLNFPVWAHIIWTVLDITIFVINIRILYKRHHWYSVLYLLSFLMVLLIYWIIFRYEKGMLVSSFAIDWIMSVAFFVRIKKLSPHLRISIGVTRLFGDFFAWLFYKNMLPIINIIGIVIQLINLSYVVYAYYLYTVSYSEKKK